MSSFPNIIYGDYGDEKQTWTAATRPTGLPLGQLMTLPDGRKFRFAKAGSVAITPALLYEGPAATADHGCGTADNLAVTAATIGVSSITVTAGGTTAILKDHYAEGFITFKDDTGEGYSYKIKSNNSTATGATATITLTENDTLKIAVGANATASLRRNLYDAVLVTTADTVSLNAVAGIACASAAASTFFWVQRGGQATARIEGTWIIGNQVVAASAIAGALRPGPASSANITSDTLLRGIGEVMMIGAASTEHGVVNLKLE